MANKPVYQKPQVQTPKTIKTKLLYYGDINPRTGFGQIADNVIPGLHKTGLYDIAAIGINYHGEPHKYPCHVYPVDSNDVYAIHKFPDVVRKEKPDIIFALQDLFILKDLVAIRDKLFPHIPIVGYFPVDGNNLPSDWAQCITKLDQPIVYSKYGEDLVKYHLPHLDNLEMIYHAINTKVYRILPIADREAKRKLQGWEDKFVWGCFNRFQPRKMIALVIRAFVLFYQGYKICDKCGNYYNMQYPRCDLNMCDAGFKLMPGHSDSALYLHMNDSEHIMGGNANNIKMILQSAWAHGDSQIYLPGIDIYSDAAPSTEEMVGLYNACDIFVNGTNGEGFGLTIAEALACGLPVITPRNTTGPELVADNRGILLDNCGFCNMPYDSGHLRPLFDVRSMVDAATKLYDEWKVNGYRPNYDSHYWVEKNLNWGYVIKRFHELLQQTKKKKIEQLKQVKMDVY